MVVSKTYKGYINGIYCIFRGNKPENIVLDEEVNIYYPDDGNIFVRDGKSFSAVILKDGETIEMFEEKEMNDTYDNY